MRSWGSELQQENFGGMWLSSWCVLTWLFHERELSGASSLVRMLIPLDEGPSLVTLFSLNQLIRGPIPKYNHTRCQGFIIWIGRGDFVAQLVKNLPARGVDLGSIPGLGRSPGERKGYPLQYPGLENSMDYIVHGVTNSWTWLSDFHSH